MNQQTWFRLASLLTNTIRNYQQTRSLQEKRRVHEFFQQNAYRRLSKAVSWVRLPSSPSRTPRVLPDGDGLQCAKTGKIYRYENGVLDLLANQITLTRAQRALSTPIRSWGYESTRTCLIRLSGGPRFFSEEFSLVQESLGALPKDTILDLACGHGNFTLEWAKRVGPEGLVLGVDISRAMLNRSALHCTQWGMDNVLLLRADVQRLPLVEDGFDKVNCSGGFHQFTNLSKALSEISRVSKQSATLTAATFLQKEFDRFLWLKEASNQYFSLHFIPIEGLKEQLRNLEYQQISVFLPGEWFGYIAAKRGAHA